MTYVDYIKVKNSLLEAAGFVETVKRADYTGGDDDVLINFKQIAKLAGVSPQQVWLVYFLKHVTAVSSFVKNGAVASEPIDGRFQDLLNYVLLGQALIKEAAIMSEKNLQGNGEL